MHSKYLFSLLFYINFNVLLLLLLHFIQLAINFIMHDVSQKKASKKAKCAALLKCHVHFIQHHNAFHDCPCRMANRVI